MRSTRPVFAPLTALTYALLLSTSAFAQAPTGECPAGAPRVYVDRDGNIDLNGKRVSVVELRNELTAMDPKPTRACYSHGLVVGNPVPGGLSAMRTLVELELDVILYTDSTFKTVDPNN